MPINLLADDNQPVNLLEEGNPSAQSMAPQESTLGAVARAPFRIAEDLAKGAYNFAQNIPGYARQAQSEIPGAFNVLQQHPYHALSQALGGALDLRHNLLNTPKGIAEYGANRLNLIPKDIAESIPYEKESPHYLNALIGFPQYPGEELIRGAVRNAPNIFGAGKLLPKLNPLQLTTKNIVKDILNTEEQNKSKYGDLYKNLWEESNRRGVGDLSHVAPRVDIETLRKYSPKKSLVGVEEFLKNPNHETAHTAKSDLNYLKRELETKTTHRKAERNQSKAVNDAISDIESNMFKEHPDLKQRYQDIQKGYKENVIPYNKNKPLMSYKNKKISPEKLLNKLYEGEFQVQKGTEHPQLALRKKAKNALIKTGIGGGLFGGGKAAYDYLSGNGYE